MRVLVVIRFWTAFFQKLGILLRWLFCSLTSIATFMLLYAAFAVLVPFAGSGGQYLQIVENRKEKGKVKQRVIATISRMDQLHAKGRVETLIRSLSRFSERVMLILSGDSKVLADAKKIGPALIFERLWQLTGIKDAIKRMLAGRAFEFDIERAIFLTVLHRLMISGSDRYCDRWRGDYLINGVDKLDLHHLYRAMGFLGEATGSHTNTLFPSISNAHFFSRIDLRPFLARCNLTLAFSLVISRMSAISACLKPRRS